MIELQRNSGDYRKRGQGGPGKQLLMKFAKEYEDAVAIPLAPESPTTVISVTVLSVVLGVMVSCHMLKNLISLSRVTVQTSRHSRGCTACEPKPLGCCGQTELAEQVLVADPEHAGRNIHQFFCPVHGLGRRGASFVRERTRRPQARGHLWLLPRAGTTGTVGLQRRRHCRGQAAQRDRLIRLDDVPVDCFKVSSGLEKGRRPQAVLVVPTSDDDRVNTRGRAGLPAG